MPSQLPKNNCRNFELFITKPNRFIFQQGAKSGEKPPEAKAATPSKSATEIATEMAAKLPPAERAKWEAEQKAKADAEKAEKGAVKTDANAKIRALLGLPPVEKTPVGATTTGPKATPDASEKTEKAQEKPKMTGDQIKAYLQEEEAKDKNLSPQVRYARSVERVRKLEAELARSGNVVNEGWKEIALGSTTIKSPDGVTHQIKVLTSVTTGPIEFGVPGNSFMSVVDGHSAKLAAEAVGGLLMTLPVTNALKEEARVRGKLIPPITGGDLAQRIRSGEFGDKIRQEFATFADPNATSSSMNWHELINIRNEIYKSQLTADDKSKVKWGFSKTVIMNPDQQDEGMVTDANGVSKGYKLKDSISIVGFVDPRTGEDIQKGTGHPHPYGQMDNSQLPYAMNNVSVLEIDGTRYKVLTKDLLKNGDGNGKLSTIDGKELPFPIPEMHKFFSDRPIDYDKIYAGVTLGKPPIIDEPKNIGDDPSNKNPDSAPKVAPPSSPARTIDSKPPAEITSSPRGQASPPQERTINGGATAGYQGVIDSLPPRGPNQTPNLAPTPTPAPTIPDNPQQDQPREAVVAVENPQIPTQPFFILGDSFAKGAMSFMKGPLKTFDSFQKSEKSGSPNSMIGQPTSWVEKRFHEEVVPACKNKQPPAVIGFLGCINDVFVDLNNENDVEKAFHKVAQSIDNMCQEADKPENNITMVFAKMPSLNEYIAERYGAGTAKAKLHEDLWRKINNHIGTDTGKPGHPKKVVPLDELMADAQDPSKNRFAVKGDVHTNVQGKEFMAKQLQNAIAEVQLEQKPTG